MPPRNLLRIHAKRKRLDVDPLALILPTSEQPGRTYIDKLDDYSLLQIFGCCRSDDEGNWNSRLSWRKLVQVCQRWRYIMFASTSYLDMCLRLKNDSPSIATLSHITHVPLVINYSKKTVAQKDVDNIHLGLQLHGRVRRVTLLAPSPSLHTLLKPMNTSFSKLEHLYLFSTTAEGTTPVLPENFQAPDLRHLTLHGIGLPTGLPQLSSVIALSTLSLTHIGASSYFPPGHLVTRLQGLPYLETLSIGFAIPIPRPSGKGEPLNSPVKLPTLKHFTFQGLGDYLDNLVAQINTPLLERLDLTLFSEIASTLEKLAEFIQRAKGLGCPVAQVNFDKGGPSIEAGYRGQKKVTLCVNCEHPDRQVDSATQVCSAIGRVLSAVEELTLVDKMPLDRGNTFDNMSWHELLLPFKGVKKLRIGPSLTLGLCQALQSVAGGLVPECLPELQELEVQLDINYARIAFSAFIKSRESMGRPIRLLTPTTQHAKPEVQLAIREVDERDPRALHRYTNDHGRSYRNQAMELIDICQTLIQMQEPTFRSYDELRRKFQIADDALKSATHAQRTTSEEADKSLKMAINELVDYEWKHRVNMDVAGRMKGAKAEGKPKRLNLEKLLPSVEPKVTVEFFIHKSLLDRPTTVKLMHSPDSDFKLSEVLWNLSYFGENERVTLKQNPHFYKGLPTVPKEYGGDFRMHPIETCQGGRVDVLIDNPDYAGRVFLDFAGSRGRTTRTFGHVWAVNNTLIFKDTLGQLLGENFITGAIRGIPNLWSLEELPLLFQHQPVPCQNIPSVFSGSPIQITSEAGMLIGDWKEPIRRMLQIRIINIRITDKRPSRFIKKQV